jgi:hypothetical protein
LEDPGGGPYTAFLIDVDKAAYGFFKLGRVLVCLDHIAPLHHKPGSAHHVSG